MTSEEAEGISLRNQPFLLGDPRHGHRNNLCICVEKTMLPRSGIQSTRRCRPASLWNHHYRNQQKRYPVRYSRFANIE